MSDPRSRLVLAPMAGGPTTPALVSAAARAGAFGFLAAGYLTVDALADQVRVLRSQSTEPFGINLFVPAPDHPTTMQAARDYRERLQPLAELAGVELGAPRWDDDAYADKVDFVLQERPSVVSFAFGWPSALDVARLQRAGVEIWVTITDPRQVAWAVELGVDALVAQGDEAGGHRGGPVDVPHGIPTEDLVRGVTALRDRKIRVIAAGGVADAADVSRLRRAGADAVAAGTAFLRADEAGTAPVHREALAHREGTVVTRAFTGRSARALRTSWTDVFTAHAPAAYPHVHHVTAPLRTHGKATGQPELVHLWAGTGHGSARSGPAARIVADLVAGG